PSLSGRTVEALDQGEEPQTSRDEPGAGVIRMTHDHLWVGVNLKIQAARTSLDEMRKTLQPPVPTARSVVQESTSTIVGGPDWQRSFALTTAGPPETLNAYQHSRKRLWTRGPM